VKAVAVVVSTWKLQHAPRNPLRHAPERPTPNAPFRRTYKMHGLLKINA